MVIPSLLVVKGSFQGMAWLLNFALIQRPGLAQQNKKGKIPLSPALSGTFGRCQKMKLYNFIWLQQTHTQKHISLKQSENYKQTLFSSN